MRSLVVSLPLFAAFSGAYDKLDWPNDPTDPEFYFGLFGGAFVGGYGVGMLSLTNGARDLLRRMRISDPRRTWVDVVGRPDSYIIVHLKDGTVLYGYPSNFTDDPREQVREIFLTEARRLRQKDDSDPGAWEEFPSTEGVLIESTRINLIQLVARKEDGPDTAIK